MASIHFKPLDHMDAAQQRCYHCYVSKYLVHLAKSGLTVPDWNVTIVQGCIASLQRTVSFTCHCFAGLQRTVLVFVVVLEEIYPGKLYFQANPQVQTEIQNADSDIYPHIPVGVGTTSKADPAVAPVAIEAASGVAVPPLMRQMRRAMHVDAVAQDSATDMMVPKIPPQHLVVGSRVEGLF